MTRLVWDSISQRLYETGIDRGVLFLPNQVGVAWNGLTSIEEKPTGADVTSYYIDGLKYLSVQSTEEFEATINAYSSPYEFRVCEGETSLMNGLFATQQKRSSFNLVYRTKIGNPLSGSDYGYKIHIVYNALASPTSKDNATLSDSVTIMELSWDVSTVPIMVSGHRPISHLIIDSTVMDNQLIQLIESYIFGNDGMEARLPDLEDLISFVSAWTTYDIDGDFQFKGAVTDSLPLISYSGYGYYYNHSLWIWNNGAFKDFGVISLFEA